MGEAGRKCPYCAEEIKVEAIKCKHCGSEVDSSSNEQKKQSSPAATKADWVPYPLFFVPFVAISLLINCSFDGASSSSDSTAPVATEAPAVKVVPVEPIVAVAPVETSHWGDYQSTNNWKWKVFIIPEDISRAELIATAREVFRRYPDTRSRFFDDAEKIQEYIDAEKFLWDTTGNVARAEFPTEWRKQHLIAIINDRSTMGYGRWQLVYNKGGVSEHLVFLE